jgi:hypothetical protein
MLLRPDSTRTWVQWAEARKMYPADYHEWFKYIVEHCVLIYPDWHSPVRNGDYENGVDLRVDFLKKQADDACRKNHATERIKEIEFVCDFIFDAVACFKRDDDKIRKERKPSSRIGGTEHFDRFMLYYNLLEAGDKLRGAVKVEKRGASAQLTYDWLKAYEEELKETRHKILERGMMWVRELKPDKKYELILDTLNEFESAFRGGNALRSRNDV